MDNKEKSYRIKVPENLITIDFDISAGMPNFRYDPSYFQKCDTAAHYTVNTDSIKIVDVSLMPNTTPADITNAIKRRLRNG